ncbi:MAG: peptidylprolyl isomerase [Tissierellales bacterium]|nr:peptidylprolyl isomerase [Tissierellales bacterium]MBN2826491.1 peptidylprolyl isomerase [Tissierellales bacterium]
MENKIIAKVNGKEITSLQLEKLMNSLPPEQLRQVSTPEGQKMLIEEIIAAELIYLDAIDDEMDKHSAFLELLEEAKKSILQRYAIEKLIAGISTNEEEMLQFYEANKMKFFQPERVSARHILVKEESEINEIREKIIEGLEFSNAAEQYSTCPSKKSGGNLGAFEKGKMVPEFEAAAFSLPVGELSQPIKTQFGFHLIMVDEKMPSQASDFEAVKDAIKKQIINQKQLNAYHGKLEGLRQKYSVEMI